MTNKEMDNFIVFNIFRVLNSPAPYERTRDGFVVCIRTM